MAPYGHPRADTPHSMQRLASIAWGSFFTPTDALVGQFLAQVPYPCTCLARSRRPCALLLQNRLLMGGPTMMMGVHAMGESQDTSIIPGESRRSPGPALLSGRGLRRRVDFGGMPQTRSPHGPAAAREVPSGYRWCCLVFLRHHTRMRSLDEPRTGADNRPCPFSPTDRSSVPDARARRVAPFRIELVLRMVTFIENHWETWRASSAC